MCGERGCGRGADSYEPGDRAKSKGTKISKHRQDIRKITPSYNVELRAVSIDTIFSSKLAKLAEIDCPEHGRPTIVHRPSQTAS